ncbi:MAG TPA: DHH family phosphoesterase, partial [Candidatus Dojkabacteria bacterium]
MLENVHVIHHNDLDGFCSAFIFYRMFPKAKFYMRDYSDPVPVIKAESERDKIYIVDLSFDRKVMENWNNLFHVQLLDHHKSAQEKLGDLPYCYFDMTKCGARLAWEYCFPNEPAHWLIDYVEDLDLWKWEIPQAREVIAALEKYKFNFKVWDKLYQKTPQDLAEEGKVIVEYNDQLVEDHMARIELINFKGYENVPIVYCNISAISSDLGNKMIREFSDVAPFAVTWQRRGGKNLFSLRSLDTHMDVSEVAKKL